MRVCVRVCVCIFIFIFVVDCFTNQCKGKNDLCHQKVVRSEEVPLPLGAWEGQRYFVVALTGPSI